MRSESTWLRRRHNFFFGARPLLLCGLLICLSTLSFGQMFEADQSSSIISISDKHGNPVLRVILYRGGKPSVELLIHHDHGRLGGLCSGMLRISPTRVSFTPSNPKNAGEAFDLDRQLVTVAVEESRYPILNINANGRDYKLMETQRGVPKDSSQFAKLIHEVMTDFDGFMARSKTVPAKVSSASGRTSANEANGSRSTAKDTTLATDVTSATFAPDLSTPTGQLTALVSRSNVSHGTGIGESWKYQAEAPRLVGCVLEFRQRLVNNGVEKERDFGFGQNVLRIDLRLIDWTRSDVQPLVTLHPAPWITRLIPTTGNFILGTETWGFVPLVYSERGAADSALLQLRLRSTGCASARSDEEKALMNPATADPVLEQSQQAHVGSQVAQWRQAGITPPGSDLSKFAHTSYEHCIGHKGNRANWGMSCSSYSSELKKAGHIEEAKVAQFYACDQGSELACESAGFDASYHAKDIVLGRVMMERCVAISGESKHLCELFLYNSYRNDVPKNFEKLGHYARAVCDGAEVEPQERVGICEVAKAYDNDKDKRSLPKANADPATLLASLRSQADGPFSPAERQQFENEALLFIEQDDKKICDGRKKPDFGTQGMHCSRLARTFRNRLPGESSASYDVKACQLLQDFASCNRTAIDLKEMGNYSAARQSLGLCSQPECLDALSMSYEFEEPANLDQAALFEKLACEKVKGTQDGADYSIDLYCTRAQALGVPLDVEAQHARVRQEATADVANARQRVQDEQRERAASQHKGGGWDTFFSMVVPFLAGASMAQNMGANGQQAIVAGLATAAKVKQITSPDGGQSPSVALLTGAAQALSGQATNPIQQTANEQIAAIHALADAKTAQDRAAAQQRLAAQQAAQQTVANRNSSPIRQSAGAGGADSGSAPGPGTPVDVSGCVKVTVDSLQHLMTNTCHTVVNVVYAQPDSKEFGSMRISDFSLAYNESRWAGEAKSDYKVYVCSSPFKPVKSGTSQTPDYNAGSTTCSAD
jgi:hypothetical protein